MLDEIQLNDLSKNFKMPKRLLGTARLVIVNVQHFVMAQSHLLALLLHEQARR